MRVLIVGLLVAIIVGIFLSVYSLRTMPDRMDQMVRSLEQTVERLGKQMVVYTPNHQVIEEDVVCRNGSKKTVRTEGRFCDGVEETPKEHAARHQALVDAACGE